MLPNELFCFLAFFDSVAVVRLAHSSKTLWRALENYEPLWRVVFNNWPAPLFQTRFLLIQKWPSARCVPELIAENIQYLALCSRDGRVVYNIGNQVFIEQRALGPGRLLALSASGRYVVYWAEDHARLMDTQTRALLYVLAGVRFVGDVLYEHLDTIRPVDVQTGGLGPAWPASTNVADIATDGAHIYTWHWDGSMDTRRLDGSICHTTTDGYIQIADGDGPVLRAGGLHWRGQSVATTPFVSILHVSATAAVYRQADRMFDMRSLIEPRYSLFRWTPS